MIQRRSSATQPLVVVSILLLLILAISPMVMNGTSRSSQQAATNDSASSLTSNALQSSPSSPNATISVQPNATIDLSRTMKQITIEIALSNTPDVPPFNAVTVVLSYDPHVLTAASLDYSTNVFTQTSFQQDVIRNCLDGHGAGGFSNLCQPDDGPGIASFGASILGGTTPDGTQGNIFILTFNVNTTVPAFSQIQIKNSILANGSREILTARLDGYYTSLSCGAQACKTAVANFTWVPQLVRQGEPAVFNGNASIPSTGAIITDYFWFFNDPTSPAPSQDSGSNSTVSHVYGVAGNYSVTLTITDSSGLKASTTRLVNVVPPLDFEIQIFNQLGSNVVFAGSDASFSVQLVGLQSFTGTVSLSGQVFPVIGNGPTLSFNPSTINLQFGFAASQLSVSTNALTPPGNYTISVTGTSGPLVHTTQAVLVVVPPPVLTVSPSSGPIGTLVVVHGSGFAIPNQGPFSSPIEIQMTFDDQLVGLLFPQGNSFNFTFNVPVSQAGKLHQIHAKELFPSTLDIQTSFLVTAAPGGLSVTISAGTIYFRADTATIFIGTSLNGQSMAVSNLQIILVLPNGSNTTLNAVQISTGYYRATYLVPSTGLLGTYAVAVTAQQAGASAQSALTTFEVKPTWLQSNAQNVATATGVVGAIGALGLVALAWRRGLFSRKGVSFPDF